MSTNEGDDLYSYLDTEEGAEERSTYTGEEGEASSAGVDEAYEELYGMTSEEYWDSLGGATQQGADEHARRLAAAREYWESGQSEGARKRMLERVGLREGTKLYGHAERLAEIAAGRRKTEGQLEAERELAILAKAQRGRAMGYGGFDAADVMQRAGRSAQEIEIGGESAISKTARKASQAAKDQLEQLLIAGEQRAEDRALAMQQLAFQQEQASGALWSNVLGGVLGAIGAVVGSVVPGASAVTATIGASVGSAMGGGAGRYMG